MYLCKFHCSPNFGPVLPNRHSRQCKLSRDPLWIDQGWEMGVWNSIFSEFPQTYSNFCTANRWVFRTDELWGKARLTRCPMYSRVLQSMP